MLYIDLPTQPKHAIPKTAGVAYSVGMGKLGWQYGTGLKFHGTVTNWCTQKRVTCELQWQLFPLDDDQNMPFQKRRKLHILLAILWEEIEVGVKVLYNSVYRKVQSESWRNDAVEKTAPSRRGPRDPRFEQLEIRLVGDKIRVEKTST